MYSYIGDSLYIKEKKIVEFFLSYTFVRKIKIRSYEVTTS